MTLEQSRQSWSALQLRAAGMMVGLDCEAVGIVVIDLDRKGNGSDVDGVAEFHKLCVIHNIDLDGCTSVVTPSGGRHLYFADPSGRWRNTTSALAPSVDTRGVGGFIVAPGSKRNHGTYIPVRPSDLNEFINTVSKGLLPQPPPGLASLLDAKCLSKNGKQAQKSEARVRVRPPRIAHQPGIGGLAPPPSPIDSANSEGWSLAAAKAEITAAVVGTRNDTMSRVAFIMGLRAPALGLTKEVTIAALMESARQAGWDDEVKTRDTAERQFAEGLARATLTSTSPLPPWTYNNGYTQGATTVSIALGVRQRNSLPAIERALLHMDIKVRRDLFKDLPLISNGANGILPPDREGYISDNACRWLARWMREKLVMTVTWKKVSEALADLAEHNTFNPVVDWLNGLNWDGVSRLDAWLPRVTGGDPTPLTCAAGVLVLQGMVMRARWPGSKFDYCLVLEGSQGLGKSSLTAAMCDGPGPGYFTDPPGFLAMDGKSRGELIRGKWLVELAELAGLHKREVEEIKAFVSLSADQYRRAYGMHVVEQLRTAVFIGTTNASQYLQDVTGNRRFIPIACKAIDLSWFRQNRDQLFAEADSRVRALVGTAQEGRPLPVSISEQFALPREHWAELEELTEDRREASPLEILLPDIVDELSKRSMRSDAKGRYITSTELLNRLQLTFPKVGASGLTTQMRRLGWCYGRTGKGRARVYYSPPEMHKGASIPKVNEPPSKFNAETLDSVLDSLFTDTPHQADTTEAPVRQPCPLPDKD